MFWKVGGDISPYEINKIDTQAAMTTYGSIELSALGLLSTISMT